MNFITENIFLIALALISGGALLLPTLQWNKAKLSLLRATQIINSGKALILDIREPAEFQKGHLAGSKNAPLKELGQKLSDFGKFKNRPVLVVCETGRQSDRAVAQLKQAGFDEVYSLDGGITAWQTQGLPVAKLK